MINKAACRDANLRNQRIIGAFDPGIEEMSSP
jgi:hypothetical protein